MASLSAQAHIRLHFSINQDEDKTTGVVAAEDFKLEDLTIVGGRFSKTQVKKLEKLLEDFFSEYSEELNWN